MMETAIDFRSKSQMMLLPSSSTISPPTTEPASPSVTFTRQPSPRLLMILLAMKPVISPKTIQPSKDTPLSAAAPAQKNVGQDRCVSSTKGPGNPALAQTPSDSNR